jgi:hypothetical protein
VVPRPDAPSSSPAGPVTSNYRPPTAAATVLMGGVVLGVGLTVLTLAFDRVGLPSPIPSALSWHEPDRVAADRIHAEQALRFALLEVELVDDALRGDIDDEARLRIHRWLRHNGRYPGVQAWAEQSLFGEVDLGDVEDVAAAPPPRLEGPEPSLEASLRFDEFGETEMESFLPGPVGVTAIASVTPPPSLPPAATIPSVSTSPLFAAAVPRAPAEPPPPAAPPRAAPPAVADAAPSRTTEVSANVTHLAVTQGDEGLVSGAVTSRVSHLGQCFDRAAEFDTDLAGDVEIEWDVRAGRVVAAAVVFDGLGDDIASRCMADRIRRWRFDPALEAEMSWRFSFRSVSD